MFARGRSKAEPPPLPRALRHVWDWFLALNGTRQAGRGPNPISFMEIEAFCRLCTVSMTGWEVGLIKRIDHVALRVAAGQAAQARPEKPASGAIPASNPAAIRSLLRSHAAARKPRPEPAEG